jgi:membrane-associated HD superfamily phosphohydrolase
MLTQRKLTRETRYTVKNSGERTKNVLVEYPLDANWKLVTPKEPSEKTRSLYRFKVEAKPGKPADLNVAEEQIVHQNFAITNLDDNTILYYVNAKVVGDDVKKALQEVIKRKQAIQQTVQTRTNFEQQIQTVEQEQNRIRQNMAQLDRNSDLYNRYVKMFGEQEDQVAKLRGQISELKDKEQQQRQELDKYLLSLDIA